MFILPSTSANAVAAHDTPTASADIPSTPTLTETVPVPVPVPETVPVGVPVPVGGPETAPPSAWLTSWPEHHPLLSRQTQLPPPRYHGPHDLVHTGPRRPDLHRLQPYARAIAPLIPQVSAGAPPLPEPSGASAPSTSSTFPPSSTASATARPSQQQGREFCRKKEILLEGVCKGLRSDTHMETDVICELFRLFTLGDGWHQGLSLAFVDHLAPSPPTSPITVALAPELVTTTHVRPQITRMQDGSFRAGITHCPIDLHTVIPKSPLAPYDALVVSLRSVTHPMHEESVAGLACQSGRPPSNFIRDVDGQGLAKGDYWVVLSAMRAWATTMSLDVLQRLREKSAQ